MVGCTLLFTELFSHFAVPALQFDLCVSSLDQLFHLFPGYLRNRRSRCSLHMGFLDQRFLFEHFFGNALASGPNTLVLQMTHVDFLVWFVRRYEVVRGL